MFTTAAVALIIALSLAIARAIKGPTVFDRILAGNAVGTLAILLRRGDRLPHRAPRIPRRRAHIWAAQPHRIAGGAEILPPWRPRLRCRQGAEALTGLVADLASWALILLGSFFTVVGMFGLVRMPELFTRMHAASVMETLGAGFLIFGMIVQAGPGLVSLKLLFILALFFVTAPVVTHALAQAALHERVRPLLSEDRRPEQGRRRQRRGEAAIEAAINMALLTLLAAVAAAIVRQRSLFGVVILFSSYSFLMASVHGGARCRRRRHDGGLGRRRRLDGDPARRAPPDPHDGDAAGPAAAAAAGRSPSWWEGRSSGARSCCRPSASRMRRSTGTWRRAISPSPISGDARAERGLLGAGRLSRLRHARRDDGDLHRRHRRDAAPAAARGGGAARARGGRTPT